MLPSIAAREPTLQALGFERLVSGIHRTLLGWLSHHVLRSHALQYFRDNDGLQV